MLSNGLIAVILFWLVIAASIAYGIYTVRRQRRVLRQLEKTQEALLGVTAELLVAEIKLRMYRHAGKRKHEHAQGE